MIKLRLRRSSRLLLPLLAAGLLLLSLYGLTRAQAIITNGTFDSSLAGWTPTGTAAWHSNQMAILPAIGDAIAQGFSVQQSGIYTLTFWCGDNHGTRSANGSYSVRDAPGDAGILAGVGIACATPATKTFLLLLTPGSYTLTIQFDNASGSNDIFLDNIAIVYASAGTDLDTGIANGDFFGRGPWQSSVANGRWYYATYGNPHFGAARLNFNGTAGAGWISQTIQAPSAIVTVTFQCRSIRSDYAFTIDVYVDDQFARVGCSSSTWSTHAITATFDAPGPRVLKFQTFGGNGTERGAWLDNIYAAVVPDDDDDDGGSIGEIISNSLDYAGGRCGLPLTTTTIITGSNGITQTQTTTQTITRTANLLLNYSFEQGTTQGPDEWSHTASAAYWWLVSATNARTGFHYVRNYPTQIEQSLQLRSAGQYMVGFWARCNTFSCEGDTITLYWNGVPEVIASGFISGYTIFTKTHFAGTSITTVRIDLDTTNGDIYLDDVFATPVNPDGTINCDPAYYPAPDPDDGGGGGSYVDCVMYPFASQCLTVPVGGAGTACYSCAPPSDTSAGGVSYWIAWLGCVIRNMFSCSLRVWLLNVQNVINGLRLTTNNLALWLANTGQGTATYATAMGIWLSLLLAAFWGPLAAAIANLNLVVYTDSGMGLLLALLQLIFALAGLLIDAIQMLIGSVTPIARAMLATWQAFGAPAHNLGDLIFGVGGYSSNPVDFVANAQAAGVSNDKLILFLAWGVMTVDVIAAELYLQYAQYPLLGAFAVVYVMWVVRFVPKHLPT